MPAIKQSKPNQHDLSACRACGKTVLKPVLDLGNQYLTGRFPKIGEVNPPAGELGLVMCDTSDGNNGCGLVQLSRLFDGAEMYGENYGYASSITETMRSHLGQIASYVSGWAKPKPGDAILDIGSNDATLLNNFAGKGLKRVGMDPSAERFRRNYQPDASLLVDFFSADTLQSNLDVEHFKIITSVAMFYDIDTPLKFMKDIRKLLAPDGLWFTEQSHAAAMFKHLCYDSVCHEHATYLTYKVMLELARKAGLKPLDTKQNNINGGSFSLLFARDDSSYEPNQIALDRLVEQELDMQLGDTQAWVNFSKMVEAHREKMHSYLRNAHASGKKILGYGASTKGNVLLQYCDITSEIMPAIVERDPNKFGKQTPGTNIPIISEEEGRAMKPDIFVVFPWHFRDEIIRREYEFLENGGQLLFPLPQFTVVSA